MNKKLLTHVSIAGVDNNVVIDDLAAITAAFPTDFVEWSLLYMPTKQGQPRNPDETWREAFFDASLPGRNSVHFCGKTSFAQLLAKELPDDIHRAQRWQLNVNARAPEFTAQQCLAIYQAGLDSGKPIILQYSEHCKGAVRYFHDGLTSEEVQRVTILFDDSRGFGIPKAAHEWLAAMREAIQIFGSRRHAYAGGIDAYTADAICGALGVGDVPFSIDLESGVRVNNEFSKELVTQLLNVVLPFRYEAA